MSDVVVDTSVWIDFFSGKTIPELENFLADGRVVLPPIVVAELLSGASLKKERGALTRLLGQLPLHPTLLDHWVRVGELRRALRERGVSVSTPDAHVAQCALDGGSLLLSSDKVFQRIAENSALRLL